VKHNQHDQLYIDHKFDLLTHKVKDSYRESRTDISAKKHAWCAKGSEVNRTHLALIDVYPKLVRVHQHHQRLSNELIPVRPPVNGMSLPDDDITAIKRLLERIRKLRPIYEGRARAYQKSLVANSQAVVNLQTAQTVFAEELKAEALIFLANCSACGEEYADAVREVKQNFAFRERSWTSIQKLTCYLKHMRNLAKAKECTRLDHQVSSWKEHRKIRFSAWPGCKEKEALVAEFGPAGWRPSNQTCGVKEVLCSFQTFNELQVVFPGSSPNFPLDMLVGRVEIHHVQGDISCEHDTAVNHPGSLATVVDEEGNCLLNRLNLFFVKSESNEVVLPNDNVESFAPAQEKDTYFIKTYNWKQKVMIWDLKTPLRLQGNYRLRSGRTLFKTQTASQITITFFPWCNDNIPPSKSGTPWIFH